MSFLFCAKIVKCKFLIVVNGPSFDKPTGHLITLVMLQGFHNQLTGTKTAFKLKQKSHIVDAFVK